MKGVFLFLILVIFLIGFVIAVGITSKTTENQNCVEKEDSCCLGEVCNSGFVTCEEGKSPKFDGCDENCEAVLKCEIINECVREGDSCCLEDVCASADLICEEGTIPKITGCDADCNPIGKCENIEIIKEEKNKIRAIIENQTECPENCTCTGSVTKCEIGEGREMTVVAGKSGNIIVQVKGVNMSTNVTLYKSDGKVYGVFKGNQTKVVRMFPDQVRERIREKLARELEEEEIDLDEDGTYKYKARNRAKLFAFISVREKISAELDSETGEIIRLRKSWWGFLARDVSQPVVGASCGTVSPDSVDECCKNKGYDSWNEETEECEFSE